MTDDVDGIVRFQAWFQPWLAARPNMSPVGWYVLEDLMAAWNASRADALDQLRAEIRDRKPED